MRYVILMVVCGLALAGCDDGDTHEEVIPLNLFHVPALVGVLLVAIAVVAIGRRVTRTQG